MAANFSFIPHTAQRHAHKLTPGRLGNRLTKRGLADARRADKAQDGPGQLIGALLHSQIFDNALLDLFKSVMVRVEHGLRGGQILLDLGALAPRQRQQPIQIIAHNGGFGRHGRHGAQLFQLRSCLVTGLFGKLGVLNAGLQLSHIVFAVLAVAQLFLDRLHLLIEIIFALGLFHLALNTGANALLNLKHGNFALHQGKALFKALGDRSHFQNVLLVRQFNCQMRGNRIRQLTGFGNLGNGGDDFGRNLLVELYVAFELGRNRTGQRLNFDIVETCLGERLGVSLVIFISAGVAVHSCA